MRKFKSTISIMLLLVFFISAVTGLVLFFAPHPPRIPKESVETAKAAVENGSVSLYLINKKAHEFVSIGMAAVALLHIAINWKSLKSYILKSN